MHSEIQHIIPDLANVALEHSPIGIADDTHLHIVIDGSPAKAMRAATHAALVSHYPNFERDNRLKTRITLLCDRRLCDDMLFEFSELFDNSFRRIVDLRDDKPQITLHQPVYQGIRKEFVDVEWEFVIGHLSQPVVRQKLRKWNDDPGQQLTILLCHDDKSKNDRYSAMLSRRLANAKVLTVNSLDGDVTQLMAMARYLNYFYDASFSQSQVPIELPEDEVDKAWGKVGDITLQLSNIYNVLTMPVKMRTLGHTSDDWQTFYALTANEIEQLTAVEHNRWSVERLIQGTRPCTEAERAEITADISLKKRYKNECGAHYDLVAFSELGVDETGLPVSRYDRDLTAAIPLIVKTFSERNHG